MKRNKIFSKNYFKYTVFLIAGLFLGWLFFHNSGGSSSNNVTAVNESHGHEEENTIWTCAMHPQIRMEEPGKCPICGMELIPLSQSGNVSVDDAAIHLSDEAMALASVQTTAVSTQNNNREIRLYGKVQADERLIQSQVSHLPGRIDKLYVNFTGENVRSGQPLVEIYSPDLVTAGQELLQTAETKSIQPELYEASKERLRQWKLSDEQINEIESSGKVINNYKILSNTSGTVTARLVNAGDHVSAGTVLFTVADLSKVWILFDAYESDLSFLHEGNPITFTLQSFPGKEYKGKISFIDPVVDPVTRVTRVRVEYNNADNELKPEMFATGMVSGNLPKYGNNISVPASAVLWTGKRSIVYVKQPGNTDNLFRMREVELGPALGDSYVIVSGLSTGEEIVTNGTFSVDASAQLEGKPSMMNPAGGVSSTGHNHSEADNDQSSGNSATQSIVNDDFKREMNGLVDKYLLLRDAFVESDAAKARVAANDLTLFLSGIDMNLLKEAVHTKWMNLSRKINEQVSAISKADDIETQRIQFSLLSEELYKVLKTCGLIDKKVFRQFCPMAFNNKGAYWVSDFSEIKNPYFGAEMLTCGETRETLEF